MKNEDSWRPSKYVLRRGALVGSRNVDEVGVSSRLIADLIASHYDAYVPRYARGKLVDLGCGKVPLYGVYRPHVDSVTCVDWGHSVHADSHLDVRTSLSEKLPFSDGQFDTIILSDVLEHIAEPGMLWAEMARILAPNGHALVNVPFLYGVHEAPYDFYRYTEYALRRFASLAGLEVCLLDVVGGSLEVLADLIAKHLTVVPVIGVPLSILIQAVVTLLGRTGWGRALAARTGARFPLGYFMVVQRPVVVSQ